MTPEIAELFVLGTDAIPLQEKRGQRPLANNTQLPSEMRGNAKLDLVRLGVVFGNPVKGDQLFVEAALPEGWKKVPTDHALWTDLVDADGKRVAQIFYKAAFYDRRAWLSID